jgi:alkylation response protein AidB-like acyl-CoA dehydrogenase
VPYASEMAGRVADLVPQLREYSAHLSVETIGMLADAGVFRLRVPRCYGGYECDTRTLVGVAAELGRAGGTAATTAAAYWAPTWLATMFGDHARDEVFGTPDVLVCGTPAVTSTAVPAGGGVLVNGRWESVAGVRHAHWQVAFAVVVPPDEEPYPVVALLSLPDLTIEHWPDDATTVAADLFVPGHRVMELSTVVGVSVAAVWAASSVGAVVGTALDARDWFFEGLATDCGLPFGGGSAMAHTQTRDALTMITDAERIARRLATLVDTGASWTRADTLRARADLAEVCRLTEDAVYLLATVHGSNPIRALTRVLGTATTRALSDFDTATGLTAWHRGPRH